MSLMEEEDEGVSEAIESSFGGIIENYMEVRLWAYITLL
jgi:hypothetical protein